MGHRSALGAMFALHVSACGGALPTDERWDADGEGVGSPASEWPSPAAAEGLACGTGASSAHHYVVPPEFWLGSQAEVPIAVRGAGYLVSQGVNGAPERRFAAQTQLSVAPDGSLSDSAGRPLLGYAPGASSGGPCVMPLRAPLFLPPEATTRVSITMNFDAQAINGQQFDLFNPYGTSDGATGFAIKDSLGRDHITGLYFTNLGGNLWSYQLLADGSELAGGTPGYNVLLSVGYLQFTSDGALMTATTPQDCISFAGGATTGQCLDIDFGPDITTSGSSGLAGSTQFAAPTMVWSQDVNGFSSGTGSDVHVGGSGLVTVEYDSGAALEIGSLALARFATEAALAPETDGTFTATAKSGPPQLGYPLSPGRGSLE